MVFSGFARWLYKIFSAKVNGLLPKSLRTSASFSSRAWYGGVIEVQSFSWSGAWVAKYLRATRALLTRLCRRTDIVSRRIEDGRCSKNRWMLLAKVGAKCHPSHSRSSSYGSSSEFQIYDSVPSRVLPYNPIDKRPFLDDPFHAWRNSRHRQSALSMIVRHVSGGSSNPFLCHFDFTFLVLEIIFLLIRTRSERSCS